METLPLVLIYTCWYHSDPTYEAWKLVSFAYPEPGFRNSDPTYEAWKLV